MVFVFGIVLVVLVMVSLVVLLVLSEFIVVFVVVGEGQGVVKVQFVVDCWIQVIDVNGKVLVSVLKCKGDSLELVGKVLLELCFGFVCGVQVSYNGQLVDVIFFVCGEMVCLKVG